MTDFDSSRVFKTLRSPFAASALMLTLAAVGAVAAYADDPVPEKPAEEAAKADTNAPPKGKLARALESGKEKLARLFGGKNEAEVDTAMRTLREVVQAAAQNAVEFCKWDPNKQSELDAKHFDDTMKAIDDYVELVADDGPVHDTAKRIRAKALELARVLREKKANADADFTETYDKLVIANERYAAQADVVWQNVVEKRRDVEETAKKVRRAREVYLDVKATAGVGAALDVLKKIATDLGKVADSMRSLLKAIDASAADQEKKSAEAAASTPAVPAR